MSHETLYRKVQRGKRTTYQVAYSAHDISQAAIDAVRNFKP